MLHQIPVLIETLWNVKNEKDKKDEQSDCGINRNIVECKVTNTDLLIHFTSVLIETLWNVKTFLRRTNGIEKTV